MKKLMMIFGLVALTVAVGILAQGTRAADAEEENASAEDILSRQAERSSRYAAEDDGLPISRLHRVLYRMYDVFPLLETPPRETLEAFPESAFFIHNSAIRIPMDIRRGQSLRMTLDTIKADSGGMLDWDIYSGLLCIYPTRMPDGKVNPLELTVSLSLHEASPWEALQQFGAYLNGRLGPDTVFVNPLTGVPNPKDRRDPSTASPTTWGYQPPEWFTQDTSITLDLVEMPAREALCAILAASPYPLQIRYQHQSPPHRDLFTVIYFWDAYDTGPPMEDEDMIGWLRERAVACGTDPDEVSTELPRHYPLPPDFRYPVSED